MVDEARLKPKNGKAIRVLMALAGAEARVAEAGAAAARAVLEAEGVAVEVITLSQPQELPQALGLAHRLQDFDGFVALGAVIGRPGLAAELARALTGLGLGGGLNGNGLVEADSVEDALALAPAAGAAAARSLVDLLVLAQDWAGRSKGIGFRP
jgi:6,7-dimethyl-8-ribityllumazine synthase